MPGPMTPIQALITNYGIDGAQIVPRMYPQVLGGSQQFQLNQLLPVQTGQGTAAHNVGGGQPVSTDVKWDGAINAIVLNFKMRMHLNALTLATDEYAIYRSEWRQFNWLRRATLTGGQNNATLFDMSGADDVLIQRALCGTDPLSQNGTWGFERYNLLTASIAGTAIPTNLAAGTAFDVNQYYVLPMSRHLRWPFGAPLLGSRGRYTLALTWAPLFVYGGTAAILPAGALWSNGSPYGITPTNNPGATYPTGDLFTVESMQITAMGVGVNPPVPGGPGVTSDRLLTADEFVALYGQLLVTRSEAPVQLTTTNQPLPLKGYHILSNCFAYLEDTGPAPIAPTLVGAAPAMVAGTAGPPSRSMPPNLFDYTAGAWQLSIASGTQAYYVSADALSLATLGYLTMGTDLANGAIQIHSDSPGTLPGIPVPPTQAIDALAVDEYQLVTAFQSLPFTTQATVLRQFYTPVAPTIPRP